MSRRIVLNTFGSLGDLHPYLAIALELKARGHRPVIATTDRYGDKVARAGIDFFPVRPSAERFGDEQELLRRIMDSSNGPAFVIREIMLPHLRDTYEDTLEVCRDADLMLSHPLTFCVPLIAERWQKPWLGTVLQPSLLFSKYDPPVLPQGQFLAPLYCRVPWLAAHVFRIARWMLNGWTKPIQQFRSELGLPPSRQNPLMEGAFSDLGNLALFSPQLGMPQRDWPVKTTATGFAFYDRQEHDRGLPVELQAFLQAGSPPIVFTLGSSAVHVAGNFYQESLQAARKLKRRAVFLIGPDERNQLGSLPDDMFAADYAPYSELFPHAAAIVHQGGAGTTGQAMRAGKPTVIVPFSHDQPDHAARLQRRGVSVTVSRHRYSAELARRALERVLGDPAFAQRAAQIGELVRQEQGAKTACDVLEQRAWGI